MRLRALPRALSRLEAVSPGSVDSLSGVMDGESAFNDTEAGFDDRVSGGGCALSDTLSGVGGRLRW